MKCTDVYLHICENLDHNIDSPEYALIRMHLGSCHDCTAYLDSLNMTVALYRLVPPPRVSREAHSWLAKMIKTHDSHHKAGMRSKGRRSK